MRKALPALLVLLLSCSAFAGDVRTILEQRSDQTMASTSTCYGNTCSDFLICQNFEGSGYDNGESWTDVYANSNPDYTTTALRGAESWYGYDTGSDALARASISGTPSEAWFFLRFQVTNSSASGNKIVTLRYGTTTRMTVEVLSTGYLRITHGISSKDGTTPIANSTTYYLWGYYKASTGGNGIATIWLNTSGTKPTDSEATLPDGSQTGSVDRIYLTGSLTTSATIIDQVLVDDSSIGDVCE